MSDESFPLLSTEEQERLRIFLVSASVIELADGIGRRRASDWPSLRRMIESAEEVIRELGYDDEAVDAYNRAMDGAAAPEIVHHE